MKGQHLQIGNLVYYNGTHEEIGIVSEILKNGLHEVSPYKIGINHRIDIYYNIDKLKPIPLTEEWLLKFNWNGYNPLHFNSNFEIDKQGRLYCNRDYKGVNINYVHQLQNLYFSLTGNELILKNS